MASDYRPRLVDGVLDDLLGSLPAVLLVGPRAAGKTTTALRRARTSFRLDRPADATAMASDPDAILAAATPPVLIDEWQLVPEVLGAVKRLVDAGSDPGRFLLTGSSAADLQAAGWPATGRIVRVPMWPMTVRERLDHTDQPSLIDRCFHTGSADPTALGLTTPEPAPTVVEYIEMALDSGFPDLIDQPNPNARTAWLHSYVDQLVMRDALLIGEDRDPRRLRTYLQALAATSAGVVTHKTLHDAAGITRPTALAYDALLETLFLTEQVPAWTTNRLKHLTKTTKRYLTEPALLGPLLQIEPPDVTRDGALLGSLLDTFVAAQLRAEAAIATTRPQILHLRQANGRHEIDLMLQGPAGQVIAIEIKATAAPTPAMAHHLRWLRDQLGNQFTSGIVFHTGPRPFALDDRIWALPIWTLWN